MCIINAPISEKTNSLCIINAPISGEKKTRSPKACSYVLVRRVVTSDHDICSNFMIIEIATNVADLNQKHRTPCSSKFSTKLVHLDLNLVL